MRVEVTLEMKTIISLSAKSYLLLGKKKLTIEYSWFYFVLVNVTEIRYRTLPFEKIL